MGRPFSLSDLSPLKKPQRAAEPQRVIEPPVEVIPAPRFEQPAPRHELAKVSNGPALSSSTELVPVQAEAHPVGQDIFASETLRAILKNMGVKPSFADIVIKRSEAYKEPLAQIMRDFGFLSGEGVAEAVSKQTRLRYFRPEEVENIDRASMTNLRMSDFEKYVPVGRNARGMLCVAVPDASVVSDATNAFHHEPHEIVVASEHTIQAVYRKFFANTDEALNLAIQKYLDAVQKSTKKDEDNEESQGFLRTIYFSLLRHACYSGASDLYLYRSDFVGLVRLKINGVGYIDRTLPKELYERLLNKMVQDNSRAEELRIKPKEAVIEFSEKDRAEYHDIASRFGFRLELTQSRGVNSAVIRILDTNSSATDLNKLSFDAQTKKALRQVTRTATGFFLVTGPTGSGKTTSLYALLKDIDAVSRSIQSIENPIEYKHGLWMQFEMRKDAGNEGDEYNAWLKALLRNAPDVILVGEVRDREVANVCMDAANTGHLVFATLHTNSAVSALARMKALNVDMNMFGSCLLGILAQRLVQTLCTCAEHDDRPETQETLKEAKYLKGAKLTPKVPKGCELCEHKGYRGRRMIYELLEMTPAVREAVESGKPPSYVGRIGLPVERSMWACGLRLVAEGVTSLDALEQVANKPAMEETQATKGDL